MALHNKASPNDCHRCIHKASESVVFGHNTVHCTDAAQVCYIGNHLLLHMQKQGDLLKGMPRKKQVERLTAIKKLVNAQNKIKIAYPRVNWQYEPVFSFYFKLFLQDTSNADEQHVSTHNHMGNTQ